MFLEKDGIRIEVLVAVDIARLQRAGYKEVKDAASEGSAQTPEEANAEAVEAVNSPKTKKGGEK